MNVGEIKKRAVPLLKSYGVARAGVFGSVTRGDAGAGSDVNILVELPKDASLLDLAGLKIDLEGMLGNEVDVLTYNSLYSLLKE